MIIAKFAMTARCAVAVLLMRFSDYYYVLVEFVESIGRLPFSL